MNDRLVIADITKRYARGMSLKLYDHRSNWWIKLAAIAQADPSRDLRCSRVVPPSPLHTLRGKHRHLNWRAILLRTCGAVDLFVGFRAAWMFVKENEEVGSEISAFKVPAPAPPDWNAIDSVQNYTTAYTH